MEAEAAVLIEYSARRLLPDWPWMPLAEPNFQLVTRGHHRDIHRAEGVAQEGISPTETSLAADPAASRIIEEREGAILRMIIVHVWPAGGVGGTCSACFHPAAQPVHFAAGLTPFTQARRAWPVLRECRVHHTTP